MISALYRGSGLSKKSQVEDLDAVHIKEEEVQSMLKEKPDFCLPSARREYLGSSVTSTMNAYHARVYSEITFSDI